LHLAIIGHIAIDTIVLNGSEVSSIGGPPCYAGLTAKRLSSDVTLVTKTGADFPDEYLLWLARKSINFAKNSKSLSDKTTRFRIDIKEAGRSLQLTSKCTDIEISQLYGLDSDGVIVSPIAGEIPRKVSDAIVSKGIVTFLDPQGYLRKFDKKGFCSLRELSLSKLPKASIIKIDPEEGYLLTNTSNLHDIALKLRKHFENVIVTNGAKNVIIASERITAELKVPKVKVADTTGLGDIFAGSFMAKYLKTNDLLWAACVGIACASSAAKGKGINKIDEIRDWEDIAEQVNNQMKKLA
jgi:sugar/nucleoside kinase (ribokinase family)